MRSHLQWQCCKLSLTVLLFLSACGIFIILHKQHKSWNDTTQNNSFRSALLDEGGLATFESCHKLALPQPAHLIPLSQAAYDFDVGTVFNVLLAKIQTQPAVILALPRWFVVRAKDRINEETGLISEIGNSRQTLKRAQESSPANGIFIDVGGWVGDSSFPSAANGIDTYVFEPVRGNTNLMHVSLTANECHLSKHLRIVNAAAGDYDGNTTIYVTYRSDNSALSKAHATLNVGRDPRDNEEAVQVVKLDTFFPPGTRVQNLKIDVQGYELNTLRGAERILRENKGRIKVRFEYDKKLLRAAGTEPTELIQFMETIGYRGNASGENVDMQ